MNSSESNETRATKTRTGPILASGRKCPKCKTGSFERKHACPWQSDIAANNEKHCNCCASCQNDCVADI